MSKDVKPSGCAALLAVAWSLFVTSPLYLVLTFGILQHLPSVPQWMWVCYWVYAPCVVLGVILHALMRLIEAGER